ncbi:hypothetical protein PoB_007058400 [Plakobranchus ocellatus]|uniref:Uncharacterized protein n=1 Tax=Plakobranchus ocellatus TaxID=259542 RepID=A0AAV4DIR2_9GAST|nr:hypothetical protein PoB_007058400 [Plakobranchus ocellatus]
MRVHKHGDLRRSGPLSGQDAGGGARTRDRRVRADFRADSLANAPPTPPRPDESCAGFYDSKVFFFSILPKQRLKDGFASSASTRSLLGAPPQAPLALRRA